LPVRRDVHASPVGGEYRAPEACFYQL
jgi:hypothetical protein